MLWKLWLGFAMSLSTLSLVLDDGSASHKWLFNGLALLSIVLLFVGVGVNDIRPRAPWYWFGAGLASFLIADVIRNRLDDLERATFPGVDDMFCLGAHLMMLVGLVLLVKHIAPGRDKASFIDAAVVGIASFGTVWVLYVDALLDVEAGTWADLVGSLAYPVADVVLVAAAARLAVTVDLRHPPFAFIVAAIAGLAVADTVLGIATAQSTPGTTRVVDAFWLLFYVGFALAALHPANSRLTLVSDAGDRLSGVQLVIMFIATLSVPLLDLLLGTQSDRNVTMAATALLFLLILLRVFGLMEAIEAGKDQLRHDAAHDSLTGLSNRVVFAERTAAALAGSSERSVAVLFIDLDDFKTVNDSLGHHAGDLLLAEVADRLRHVVRDGDMVARFGGDEFAVLLESVADRRDAMNVARRALETLAEPIDLGPRTIRASASIGIAMDVAGTTDVASLMRDADVAMYLSKSRGKGRYEFFEPIMHEEAVERLDLRADLQRAIDEEQFSLDYQPIFDLETGRVEHVEALIRWRHPERGMISPERFIPIAEESGLIVPIGEWVLREACIQTNSWRKIRGCENIGVSVNLSIRQLQDSGLVTSLTNVLRDSGLPAEKLVLEITESMLATDSDRSVGVLELVKTIGVKLAIDDFGTGYSSLSYLKSFPVDSIKIDRSFINELHRSSTSSALVDAVVNLAQALGAYTVAEGIEHADQAGQLRRLGCDRGQGFYYCRPVSGQALTTLFREHLDTGAEPLEAWRRTAESLGDRAFDVTVRAGLADIRPVADEIEELRVDLDLPVMASWPWLQHWIESFTNWTPLMVEVRAAETGQLMACAVLAHNGGPDGTTVVAAGHSSSCSTSLPARNAAAARALAEGIRDALDEGSSAWALELEQLPDGDPTLMHLADVLDQAQVLPELRVPRVVFASAHSVDGVLTRSMRKQLRRARNRIASDGVELTIGFDRGRAIEAELIDEVESVHVARDRHQRRESDLDRPDEREFWRRVLEGGDDEWEIEIASLRLDGELAAYSVAILDGDAYRIYDGRMNSGYQKYSPGRLVDAAALGRAIGDPRFGVLDWMSGVGAERLLTRNFAESRVRLVATSANWAGGTKKRCSRISVS